MAKQRHKFLSLLLLTTTIFFAAIRHVIADDAAVLAQLAKSISPTPSGWAGPNFCKWQGVNCDSSNRVTSINLSSKSLSGAIPSDLNQLSGLKSLSLQKNQLSGPLPALTNLASLEEVYLDENSFNSIPPHFLSGLTSLQSFSINNNTNLPAWTIPETLKDSSSLTSFIASKANIVGEIPDIFESLPNFQTLRLSYNNMTGPLPPSFAKSGIRTLWLNNQMTGFSGPLYILGAMTQLQVAWLQSNHYSGPIPDLSACTELTDLQLRDNSLTGVIPDSLTKLPKLQNVALQNNKFQGPMPSFSRGVQVNLGTTNNFCLNSPGPCDPQVTALLEVAGAMNYPSALADSWEGNNPCQQWNFITCEKGSVAIVNFGKQNWTGMISPSYANLTNLKSLFLNDNKLFGTIPQSLTSLNQLQVLDLSNNNISGKIPPFASSVTIRVSGNVNIGKDVPITPPPGFPPNSNGESGSSSSGSNSKVSPWVIVIPIIVFVVVFSILGFVITKVDVYAFGVVLMEIITGRKALDDSLPDEQSHLVTWFRRLISDKEAVRAALDPVLFSLLDEDSFLSILKVAELAGHCTARESYQRPDMSHAVNVLSPLVEHWKPAADDGDEDSLGLDLHMSLPQVLQKWKANEDSSSTMSSSFFSGNTNNYGTNSSSSGMR